jgi:hypothetical protein
MFCMVVLVGCQFFLTEAPACTERLAGARRHRHEPGTYWHHDLITPPARPMPDISQRLAVKSPVPMIRGCRAPAARATFPPCCSSKGLFRDNPQWQSTVFLHTLYIYEEPVAPCGSLDLPNEPVLRLILCAPAVRARSLSPATAAGTAGAAGMPPYQRSGGC